MKKKDIEYQQRVKLQNIQIKQSLSLSAHPNHRLEKTNVKYQMASLSNK